jgi:uncharacterized membrane protein YedE/YeeE
MGVENLVRALGGGLVIGTASALLLLFNGKIFGVSGIAGGLLTPRRGDLAWRVAAAAGLLAGGIILTVLLPDAFDAAPSQGPAVTALAGLLVGVGTRLSNGCTSGHGICGVSRLSHRSLAATATFVGVGMLTATVASYLGGHP